LGRAFLGLAHVGAAGQYGQAQGGAGNAGENWVFHGFYPLESLALRGECEIGKKSALIQRDQDWAGFATVGELML
jgi:hypothetical protein